MALRIPSGSPAGAGSSSLQPLFQSLHGIISNETVMDPLIKPYIQPLKQILDRVQPFIPALESLARQGKSPSECATIGRHLQEAKSLVLPLIAGKHISNDDAERLRTLTKNMNELLPQVRDIARGMYNEPELQLSEREHRWSRSHDKHITEETIQEDEIYSRVDKRTGETVHGHRIRTCYNMRDCESETGSTVTKVLTWSGLTLAALATGALTYALTQRKEEEDQNEHHQNQ